MRLVLLLFILIAVSFCHQERIEQFFSRSKGNHTNNWVVIVSLFQIKSILIN